MDVGAKTIIVSGDQDEFFDRVWYVERRVDCVDCVEITFHSVSAPNLNEFVVMGDCGFNGSKIQPKVLRVENYCGEIEFFQGVARKWREIKELYVTIGKMDDSIVIELYHALMDKEESLPMYLTMNQAGRMSEERN
jgi:hypothetical protein